MDSRSNFSLYGGTRDDDAFFCSDDDSPGALLSSSGGYALPSNVQEDLMRPPAPLVMESRHTPAPVQTVATVTTSSRIVDVFFCFFEPNGAKARSGLSSWVHWGVNILRERFTHVECLFLFESDSPARPRQWLALTVDEKRGTGIAPRPPSFYRDGRWTVVRLVHAQASEKATMYNFAVDQARKCRSYNRTALLHMMPYVGVCAPVVQYTPGCASCVGGTSAKDSVFCVQLMGEMMQHAFRSQYRDLYPQSLSPDKFLGELRRRSGDGGTVLVMLGPETGDVQTTTTVMLDTVGRNVWDAPKSLAAMPD